LKNQIIITIVDYTLCLNLFEQAKLKITIHNIQLRLYPEKENNQRTK